MMKRTGIHHRLAKFPNPGIPNSDVRVNANRAVIALAKTREETEAPDHRPIGGPIAKVSGDPAI